jgi:hypothetical protein
MFMRQSSEDEASVFLDRRVYKGREDLSDDQHSGRPPDIGLDEVLAHGLEADLHTIVRKIADSLGSPPKQRSVICGTAWE